MTRFFLPAHRFFKPICLALVALTGSSMFAQQFYDLGTGTQSNANNDYPSPYGNDWPGSRHQMVVLASELNGLGMGAGDILSIAFNVATPQGTPLQGFTLSLGTTAETEAQIPWITGTAPVMGPIDYTDVIGWNTHVFDVPFTWDGTSNLVVQTCFFNGSATANASMFYTPTTFNSVTYRATPNGNVCTSNTGQLVLSTDRPNMRFGFEPPMAVPVAQFSLSPTISCDGVVDFSDATSGVPDDWQWDFGDGSTDTVQDPEHTYQSDGVYTVQLIASNILGTDTAFATVTVNINGPQPAPGCVVSSPGTVAGFGITSVSYGDVSVASADALTEGYADRACMMDTVLVGTSFNLAVVCGTVTTHNVRVWIDWDNSATFDATEQVASAIAVTGLNASINVPANAALNTPLRMRIMADYDFSPFPQPCVDPLFGQAEDYGIVIIENPLPPDAAFSATPTTTCDGTVQLTDLSLNVPTGWTWDFGDGNGSNDQNPLHTYTTSGTYTVSLTAINPNGSDTETQVNLVVVDLNGQTAAPLCTPQTQSWCCGYGILGVQFAGINSTSPDGSEGYQDRTCGNQAAVTEGNTYPISISTGTQNNCDTYVWIDLDGDGDFTGSELLFSALGTTNPSGNISVPLSSAFGVPVRLRVATEVIGELTGSCDAPLFGQVEDFSVIITQNTNPPSAAFGADPITTCDGVVQFTDQSANLPLGWDWDFGDGNGSTDQNPTHTYTATGTYTVSLTVTNNNGSDTEVQTGLIQFLEPAVCDTNLVDDADIIDTDCTGIVADDGGPNEDYTPGQSGLFTIAPTIPAQVTLTFVSFAFEPNDSLVIFDGPDDQSPLIGAFNGQGVGALPDNGVITSTNGALTLWQKASNGQVVDEGFVATWTCSPDGIAENSAPSFRLSPVPADDVLNVFFVQRSGADATLTLTNALGAIMEQRSVANAMERTAIDVSTWPAGFYAISLNDNKGRSTKTFVVR